MAGYGTAVGDATQYSIETGDAVIGVLLGAADASVVAGAQPTVIQELEAVAPGGQVPIATVEEVANIPGATIVALIP